MSRRTSGSWRARRAPPSRWCTYAKTGTAQYGTAKPLKTDAWLMGFKGDIAFAAPVVNSAGNGGPTCGPIVARFLRGL